ncbi:hypothetical protein FOZ62_027341 [Perkinsus olseni]|uniref:subtilisin n=1 Tax=Perkinsus olseni TaxID=32597 RepID=A0A7J6QDT2_PEROL|nr:hypothetical protein FOZ62_027341 [Perkinsus olseni]
MGVGYSCLCAVAGFLALARRDPPHSARGSVDPRGGSSTQLDVQNAFPSVKHSHILATLARYDVPRYLIDIVESYLEGQSVAATYGSDEATVGLERGVPQGSALGPFLFLLSTLPLVDAFSDMEEKGVSLTLYADDTTVVVSAGTGPSLVKRWPSAEALLLAWAADAGVSYEPAKSQALLPRTIGDDVLSLDGTPVDIVKVVRVLGVLIDRRLSFQHHIKVKCAEAKAKLGRLRHLGWARAGITGKKVIKTYKVAIVPALSHAVAAWKEGLESVTAKSALLQVSAMVARIALQAPRNREDGVGNWWLMAEAMDMALDIGVDIAFRAATDQDIILVACAGNHGKAADTYYPCALPGVVCVASLDMQDPLRVSSFSNYGNSVDIAAYGSGVYTGSGQYASGTSSSCPLVSGAAAILLAMGVKPEYVAGMLTYNVDRFASPLRPLKKHAGALNPLKAVRMAIDFPVLRGAR